jgi:predicted O-linked N-acetylglucosamine transferase (SPINDLY family)
MKAGEISAGRTAAGLPESGFVFCCFNNAFKFNPAVFAIWMRLLNRLEHSVLWLPEQGTATAANLRREAEKNGVDSARIVFAKRTPRVEDHFARLALADLFLDTLPYNAHTTASDALWAGLPVLTCMGATFAARVAGSLLNAAGLPELITHSLADYEALALKLATTTGMLVEIKSRLERNCHTLFDADRFRRHIEAAYLGMWQRAQDNLPPAGFAVQ